ncbi:metallophosphoesterase [Alkalimarinus sediminis]|uniref:Metallophosphoesterase n=1 Tax=Alkalimarinus sediminis TaxID=1632866 RepID=A0A9E8HGM2_9ALTE|nr:metallophosphoesterase [Alkalimarinus sediminis]UZW74310.1 metallophosphoesterase [Alkalimarinus sediminis]
MNGQLLKQLEERMGPKHAKQRLDIEKAHTAQVFGQGRNFFHIENWYSVHSLIRNALRLCFMHKKGQQNARNIRIINNTIQLPNLHQDFDGFTILHLSDLHVDMDEQATLALIQRIREVDYDICVMTGDYRARTFGDIEASIAAMQKVRVHLKQETYAVLGNHDSILMVPALEEMGITLLLNEWVHIKQGDGEIYLAGVDDAHYFQVDDIVKASREISPTIPSILLSHTPAIYQQAADAGFDIVLSGHTHGGQICLPGGIPITLDSDCPRFVGKGPWRYNNTQGYTSVGAGTSIVNVRINCPPEITLHRLTK